MKAIYKSAALLLGAMSFFSSCEDFLTRDPQDSYILEDYLNTNEKLLEYTRQICGPLTWNGFDDKFSWCVGELYSGNVYHNFDDEGQFHFMTFTPNNAHISNGYTSLYSVIAKCNHIINDIPDIAKKNGISSDVLNRVLGEAHMYRGMAYFYLAEYWGASPIVLHNSATVAGDKGPEITKADRKSLYTLIEKDWMEAAALLPDERQAGCKAWKASALGMLCKLYVTMASCQTPLSEPGSYLCEDPNRYYENAIKYGEECMKLADNYLAGKDVDGYEAKYQAYEEIFKPGTESPEVLFALLFEQGVYAQGCSRQIQFARSKFVAGGGDAYGGEKGLTYLLFHSYDRKKDVRLKATSYYWGPIEDYSDTQTKQDVDSNSGHYYIMNDGSKYYYFLNPNKTLKKADRDNLYGNEPISAIFNHCRKFVYGVKPIDSQFSINLTIPLLRTADVKLLIAEAKIGKEHKDVTDPSSTVGLDEINEVRSRAGLDPVKKIAFWAPDSVDYNADVQETEVEDPQGNKVQISASCDIITPQYDLLQERRHEFALENQGWLDIKRLYYRSPEAAVEYIKTQGREFTYGEKFGKSIAKAQKMAHFQRQYLINALSVKAHAINPTYPEQAPEGKIEYDKLQFFLPTPASVPNTANYNTVKDFSEQIASGMYPY